MKKRKAFMDWRLVDRFRARSAEAKIARSVPAQWASRIELLRQSPEGLPVWLTESAWLDRLEAFRAKHGDAIHWAMSDSQICERADELARWVDDLLALKPASCAVEEKLDKVCALCSVVGVEPPVGVTAAGAVSRALSSVWWRRVLRRTVARVVEHGAIKLGVVNRRDGAYCSNDAVKRRGEQVRRNALMLEKTLMRNEAGQVFTLSELAKVSTANPEIRGGELMARIRGCEEYADSVGHVGMFFTLTTPSRFHAVQSGGKGPKARPRANPRYDGESTPRDAQLWLRVKWARVRAECAREGVGMYGFRVAEPHHDGCPHWHALLWFRSELEASQALAIIGKHWLDDGEAHHAKRSRFHSVVRSHEPGALDNRIDVKRMVRGGAAGYVAKYVAKNIGHFDVGVHLDGLEVDTGDVKGWQRVDAWAATWGIRQFQAIGQPAVMVWRELRRVTPDQIERARVQGDTVAWTAWGAVHKVGDTPACWKRYMQAQGGPCLRRVDVEIHTAQRVKEGHINGYGEVVTQRRVVGLELRSGRWLVSRRQAWGRVAEEGCQEVEERTRKGAPWTGFNNCTARLTGQLRAALLGLKEGIPWPGG